VPFEYKALKSFPDNFQSVIGYAEGIKDSKNITDTAEKSMKLKTQQAFVSNMTSSGSFREEILKELCGGSDSDLRVKKASEINWGELIMIVSDYKTILKDAQSTKDDIGLAFKATFRYLNNVKSEMKSSDNESVQEKSKNISKVIKSAKVIHSVSNEAYGIFIEALKKHRSQARGCLTKALVSLSGGKKSTSKAEEKTKASNQKMAEKNGFVASESYDFLGQFMDAE